MNDNQKNAEQIADSIEPSSDRKGIASECKKSHRKIEHDLAASVSISINQMHAKIREIAKKEMCIDVLTTGGLLEKSFEAAYRAGHTQGICEMVDAWNQHEAVIKASEHPASPESEGS